MEHLKFNLLENSHDFILEAVCKAEQDDLNAWKYAILNLASGLELLLKARLEQKDWFLLFQKIDEAKIEKLESGEFISVNFNESLKRIKNLVKIDINKDMESNLLKIQKTRNKIIHFEINIELNQLKSLIATGINIYIEFYEANFSPIEESLIFDLTQPLTKFNEFVNHRLESLEEKLEHSDRYDIESCDECYQNTLVMNHGTIECLFCGNRTNPHLSLLEKYSDHEIQFCPECGEKALIGNGGWFCINCRYKSEEDLIQCSRCGNMISDNGSSICTECLNDLVGDD